MSEPRMVQAASIRYLCAVAAGSVGLAVSFLDIPILPGITVIFSGIFYLLAAIFIGPKAGVLAALIAMSRTLWMQGHPYSMALSALEAASIGYLSRRRKPMWVPAASAAFWAVVGLPVLAMLVFWHLRLNLTTGWEVILKRILTGLVDAVVADFLLILPVMQRPRYAVFKARSGPLREVLATGLLAMTLVPTLIYSIVQGRTVANREQQHAVAELKELTERARLQLDEFTANYLDSIGALTRERTGVANIDRLLLPGGLRRLTVTDRTGRATTVGAHHRAVDAATVRGSLLLQSVQERRPVFEAEASASGPEIIITAPAFDSSGALSGAVQATLDMAVLDRLKRSLSGSADLLILDPDSKVLYSSPHLGFKALDSAAGTRYAAARNAEPLGEFRWQVGLKDPPASIIVASTSNLTGWRVVASQSLEHVHREIEAYYLRTLLWLVGAVVLSCALAATISRRIAAPLLTLVRALREFRIGESWPRPFEPYSAPPELMQIQQQFCGLAERLADTSQQTGRALAEKDRLNNELQRLLAELDRKVQERTAELSEARAKAEAANDAKSLFLASMSHEIRTPLNAIIGIADLLASHNLGVEEQSLNEMIRTSARGLMALINDILDFSKIESGKLELGHVVFDPRDIAESVASVVALAAHEKGVDIACRVSRQVPRSVLGDPDRLQQVLMNLASNAVKFTAQGQVSVSVDAIGRERNVVHLRIQVADTGIGIPQEAQRRLFQPFSQADASTTRQFGGTGLGLAVSKRLTEQMGGTIGVESEEGRGSTFWCQFQFPVPESAFEYEQPPDFATRILVVDDSRSSCEALIESLAALGFSAHAAGDAATALSLLATARREMRPYAAAIIDFDLPDPAGTPLPEAIRANSEVSDTPLILLRSQTQRLHGADTSTLKPCVPLRKPVRRRKLLECLLDLGLVHSSGTSVPAPADETDTEQVSGDVRAASRPRILLVEDNVVNQKVASKMLERLGYEADVAPNGAAAIEALERSGYSAILMDCQMPVMDGFEATRQIRKRGDGVAKTIIIAMTANAYTEDRERCRAAGMDDYLAKPVALESLAEALERWTKAARPVCSPALEAGDSAG